MAYNGDYPGFDPGSLDPVMDPTNPPPGYRWDEASQSFVPTTAPQLQPGTPGYDAYTDPTVAMPPGASVPPGSHWDPTMANFVPDQSTNTGGFGGYGGGGGGGSVGSLIAPFTGSFTAPSSVNLGGSDGLSYIPPTPQFTAPTFTPPGYTPPPAFAAPTGESVLNEPGFKFGLDTGLQGVQQSAAARGVLNGGGTLKDIAAWANNYGSQKYGDAYNRARGTYETNLNSQYLQPNEIAFRNSMAAFAPQMAEFNTNANAGLTGYQTEAAAGQRANEFNYGNAYQQYQDQYKQYLDQQNLLYAYRSPFLQG